MRKKSLINSLLLGAMFFLTSCGGKNLEKEIKKRKGALTIVRHELSSKSLKKIVNIGFKHSLNKCYASDEELMKLNSFRNNVKKYIVTLERLDKVESPLFSVPVNVESFSEFSMEGPWGSRFSDINGVYGLFLCSDKENKGSCVNKNSFEFNLLFRQLINKSKVKKIKEDKIIWFKPVLLSESAMFVVNNATNDLNSFQNLIELFIRNKKQASKTFDRAIIVEKKLRNYGVANSEKSLLIDIAKLHPSCDRKEIVNFYREKVKPEHKRLEKIMKKKFLKAVGKSKKE